MLRYSQIRPTQKNILYIRPLSTQGCRLLFNNRPAQPFYSFNNQ
jgi:hypothetical protein